MRLERETHLHDNLFSRIYIEKKTCRVRSEGKIHTPHVLSSVHTTLDKKKNQGRREKAECEEKGEGGGEVDVYAKGDRGGLLDWEYWWVCQFTRVLFSLRQKVPAEGLREKEKKKERAKRDRAQRLNEQDRMQSS